MGVNVAAHTRHVFLGSSPSPGLKVGQYNGKYMYVDSCKLEGLKSNLLLFKVMQRKSYQISG